MKKLLIPLIWFVSFISVSLLAALSLIATNIFKTDELFHFGLQILSLVPGL